MDARVPEPREREQTFHRDSRRCGAVFAYKARGRLGGQRIGGFVPVERGLLLSSTSEVAPDEVPAFQHTSGSACMWVCPHF